MITAIILAAGKGTRINSKNVNKVILPFLGKPMVSYGVELLGDIANDIIIVVGAYSQSVLNVLQKYEVRYAYQKKRLGTGNAVKIGFIQAQPDPSSLVLVGYGDHMMFYKKKTIKDLILFHKKNSVVASFISTKYHDPNTLAWGRIERDKTGKILDIIEQKDANELQRKIKEVNAGFYCFNYSFLKKFLSLLKQSPVTHEYYITDLIKMAVKMGLKVDAMVVRFREVGIGINRSEELEQSQKIYLQRNS